MSPSDLDAAKKLFFDYEGSMFYMSRDGVEDQYRLLKVSEKLEVAWLAELTELKLQALGSPGNWRTIHFLQHRGDFSYLDQLIAAEPLGLLRERCSFLERLLSFAILSRGSADPELIRAAVVRVIDQSQKLLTRARSIDSRRRVQELLDRARES